METSLPKCTLPITVAVGAINTSLPLTIGLFKVNFIFSLSNILFYKAKAISKYTKISSGNSSPFLLARLWPARTTIKLL